jgi:hypothetical protein
MTVWVMVNFGNARCATGGYDPTASAASLRQVQRRQGRPGIRSIRVQPTFQHLQLRCWLAAVANRGTCQGSVHPAYTSPLERALVLLAFNAMQTVCSQGQSS